MAYRPGTPVKADDSKRAAVSSLWPDSAIHLISNGYPLRPLGSLSNLSQVPPVSQTLAACIRGTAPGSVSKKPEELAG